MHVAMITGTEAAGPQHSDTGLQNATEPQATALAETLANRGHEVTMYTSAADHALPAGEACPGVRLDVAQGENDHVSDLSGYLAQEWQERPPDVVHAFSPGAGLAVVAGTQDRPIPLVQDYRAVEGADFEAHDEQWQRLEVTLGCRAEQVVVSAPTHAARLAAHGVPREKLTTVPYGVDLTVFEPDGPASPSAEGHRLISVAGAGPGTDDLVRALSRLPGVELVVVGAPTTEPVDGDVTRLRELADRLGVADRVRVVGPLDGQRLAELYRSADVAVDASVDGATGVSLLQAMACGVPVVCTAIDGADDAVVDGVTGVLVPPGAPLRLAHTIRDLLAHSPRRAAYGIAAADRAAACFSWERVGDSAEAVYASALRGQYTAADTTGTYRPAS